ncbi:MAG TPA: DinB family protein [Anaerolineales bacterium]|nr:DinB family protein [Anaerolineales bacterium]
MNKRELLAELEASRGELLAAIEGLSPEEMLEPGAVGAWSVRDVLQHVSMWEAELVKLLSHVEQGRKPSGERWSGSIDLDTLNAKWHAETKDRPLEDVLADFQAVRRQMLRRMEALSDDDVTKVKPLKWLRGRPLWQWISEDTSEHDREHAGQIASWRRTKLLRSS